jgi:hypothetical protein
MNAPFLEPGPPHPDEDMSYHCDSGEAEKTLYISTVEFLRFIACKPGWASALITHGNVSHVVLANAAIMPLGVGATV